MRVEFNGIPLHPLVVHAVVIFAPLSATLAVLYAVLPKWRWAVRWPLVFAMLVAVVTGYVATLSGAELVTREQLQAAETVRKHREWGELLRNVLFGFTVVVGLAAWRLGGPSGLISGRGERPATGGAVTLVTTGLLVVGAVAVGVAVFLAGDSGARAVWER